MAEIIMESENGWYNCVSLTGQPSKSKDTSHSYCDISIKLMLLPCYQISCCHQDIIKHNNNQKGISCYIGPLKYSEVGPPQYA